MKRTLALAGVMLTIAAAASVPTALAKNGADDPPQVQVEDAPNHG